MKRRLPQTLKMESPPTSGVLDPVFGLYRIPSFREVGPLFIQNNARDNDTHRFRGRAAELGCYAVLQRKGATVEPAAFHHYLDLTFIVSGSGTLWVGGEPIPISENDLCFLSRGKSYRAEAAKGKPLDVLNLCLMPSVLGLADGLLEDEKKLSRFDLFEPFLRTDRSFHNLLRLSPGEFRKLLPLAFLIVENFHFRNDKPTSLLRGLFSALFEQILLTYQRMIPALSRTHASVERSIAFIRGHLSEKLTLEQIASVASLEPHYFSFLFNRQCGESLPRFIARERIEGAKILLQNRERSILQIALELGFADASHFSRTFRSVTGKSPREFR